MGPVEGVVFRYVDDNNYWVFRSYRVAGGAVDPCDECDDNAEHGSNVDEEMDVDDNDPTAP